jgi:hypothetical protein
MPNSPSLKKQGQQSGAGMFAPLDKLYSESLQYPQARKPIKVTFWEKQNLIYRLHLQTI